MNGEERRKKITSILESSDEPVPGHTLGHELNVSRQVIVQDIALLRSAGHPIASTNRGYIMGGKAQAIRMFKVKHNADQMRTEMDAIVDLGGCVIDVAVNHRTYGFISAPLDVKSRRDVSRFIEDLDKGVSQPLSALTDGYHFHHVSAHSNEILNEIEISLSDLGFLAPLTDYEKEMCS